MYRQCGYFIAESVADFDGWKIDSVKPYNATSHRIYCFKLTHPAEFRVVFASNAIAENLKARERLVTEHHTEIATTRKADPQFDPAPHPDSKWRRE